MTDDSALWPKAVRRMVERVRAGGFPSEVQVQMTAGEWEVFIAGNRIRASAFFGAKTGAPKTKYLRGVLLIDGAPRPLVSFGELRDLWDEHELGIVQAGSLIEVPASAGERVPAAVRLLADSIKRGSGNRMEPRCGRVGRRWAVALDLGPDTGLRMLLEQDPDTGEWDIADRNPIQLLIDGEDRSAELDGKLDKALALLNARPHPEAGAPAPGITAAAATRNQGVETRRLVVKRELSVAGT